MWMCGWRGRRFISDGKVGGVGFCARGSKWWEGVRSGGRGGEVTGGGGAFSFPIKFGWCSVFGKNEKLVFGMIGVWFAAAPKMHFKRELGGKNGWSAAGRRLTGVAAVGVGRPL